MEIHDIESAIEGILFASGEPVSVERLASVLGVEPCLIRDVTDRLGDRYSFERRGIRLLKLDGALQLCSAPEYADYIRLALEVRKQPQLTTPSLEVLAITAYFQPVTKAYIEQVRGVDSSNTVSKLLERGLIEPCGRLSVPGRPILFRTTAAFLRTFGLTSLNDLPELPELDSEDENQISIQNAIAALTTQSEENAKGLEPEG